MADTQKEVPKEAIQQKQQPSEIEKAFGNRGFTRKETASVEIEKDYSGTRVTGKMEIYQNKEGLKVGLMKPYEEKSTKNIIILPKEIGNAKINGIGMNVQQNLNRMVFNGKDLNYILEKILKDEGIALGKEGRFDYSNAVPKNVASGEKATESFSKNLRSTGFLKNYHPKED